MQSGAQEFHGKFIRSLDEDASAEQVADAAVVVWRNIDAALAPIIGQQGVAALFRRAQYLVRDQYPWLASLQQDVRGLPSFEALHSALSLQPAADSAQANGTLLQVFHDLLANLIGESLCDRLLRSVWTLPSTGLAAQDTPL